jgi:hypothetical protein
LETAIFGCRCPFTPTWPQWWSIGNVVEKMAPRADVVLLYGAIVADRLFNRVRKAAPAAKILFHPVDLSFLRMQRQADISGDQVLAEHARKTRVTELEWVARADTTIVVSAQELALLRSLRLDAVVHHIPILREAPSNGGPKIGINQIFCRAGISCFWEISTMRRMSMPCFGSFARSGP